MFNKLKSAIYNAVGNFENTDATLLSEPSIEDERHEFLKHAFKFSYTRPHFLELNSEDEIIVTGDHVIRPIICPRDISKLPWNSGYAESVNAGKSKKNEDQASIHIGSLTCKVDEETFSTLHPSFINGVANDDKKAPGDAVVLSPLELSNEVDDTMNTCHDHFKLHKDSGIFLTFPYYYFAVFDGHAGWGSALVAAKRLHKIIHEKLSEVTELLIPKVPSRKTSRKFSSVWNLEREVSTDDIVRGALEQSFWQMDEIIGKHSALYQPAGGCTACVAIFLLGKLYVANAGDSRAVLAYQKEPYPMSFDFTPETESSRIRKLGASYPHLLGFEYTHLDFLKRPMKHDIGKKVLYRDHYMNGWAYKTLTSSDIKYPLVYGEGKRSRVLATIGVTRGFGDHELCAHSSSFLIKPFLTPEPEVRIFDIASTKFDDGDVLILATDGLWDITHNEQAVDVIVKSLGHFPSEDKHRYKYRYVSAAQDLVMNSRGKLKEGTWRTNDDKHATIDDISVFVIPLKPYQDEYLNWKNCITLEPNISDNEPNLDAVSVINKDESDTERFLTISRKRGLQLKSALSLEESVSTCDNGNNSIIEKDIPAPS